MSALSSRWIKRGLAILLGGGLLVVIQSFRGVAPPVEASAGQLFYGAAKPVPDRQDQEHPLAPLLFQAPDPNLKATFSRPSDEASARSAASLAIARKADEKRRTRVTRSVSCDTPMPGDAWLDICDSEHIR